MASLSNFVIGEKDYTYRTVMKAFLEDKSAELQVQENWTKLAYKLEIDLTNIRKLEQQEKDGKAVEDIILTLLVSWSLKKGENANIKNLKDHLVDLEWNHIADNLEKLFSKATPSSSSEISTAPQTRKKLQYCFEYFEGYEPKDLFAEVKRCMSLLNLYKSMVDAMILQTVALLKINTNSTARLYLSGLTQTERFMILCELVENSSTDKAEEKTLNLFINLPGLDAFCSSLRNKLTTDFGHIAKIVQIQKLVK